MNNSEQFKMSRTEKVLIQLAFLVIVVGISYGLAWLTTVYVFMAILRCQK